MAVWGIAPGERNARSFAGLGREVFWHLGEGVDGDQRQLVGGGEVGEARRQKEVRQAKSAWDASCIYLAVCIRPPSALTSSPTIVDGVCTYV